MEPWTAAQAEALYGFRRWGGPHVRVDSEGFVTVHPAGDHRGIRLLDVVQEARSMGLRPPLTIRFQDLLRYRVEQINEAFRAAIKDEDYGGRYKGVFPIKVNQLREVVEEILDAGAPYDFGIEAGSKPELMIAMALHQNNNSLVICNGYKDPDYIRLALLGRRLGKEVIIVIEQFSELALILDLAARMDIEPLIGFRVKLKTSGEGKWAESSGEDAKFGLTTQEIVEAARRLKKAGMEKALRLVHFHIGSQVPNILTIKKAVVEAARYYVELSRMGFPMRYLDVGGGLGIDYDGSHTAFESSMNYSLEEYARDVVFNVKAVCEDAGLPVPDLVSESGRALVAPHSVFVLEVFDRISKANFEIKTTGPKKKRPALLRALDELLDNKQRLGLLERFHDAQAKKDEAFEAFKLGVLDLEQRAEADSLYYAICRRLMAEAKESAYVPEELRQLPLILADQYVGNFSVFQSLIDHWACDQLFPVAPIHRLNEAPSTQATLVDITCDSEGKIGEFIDLQDDVAHSLPLHPLDGKAYYLGVFLVGAYQDIMGDLHNLFGRVSEVHVFLEDDEEDGWYVEESIRGSKVSDVLAFIQYKPGDLSRMMKKQIDKATRADLVKPREGVRLIDFYDELLEQDTYLTPVLGGDQPKAKRPRKAAGAVSAKDTAAANKPARAKAPAPRPRRARATAPAAPAETAPETPAAPAET